MGSRRSARRGSFGGGAAAAVVAALTLLGAPARAQEADSPGELGVGFTGELRIDFTYATEDLGGLVLPTFVQPPAPSSPVLGPDGTLEAGAEADAASSKLHLRFSRVGLFARPVRLSGLEVRGEAVVDFVDSDVLSVGPLRPREVYADLLFPAGLQLRVALSAPDLVSPLVPVVQPGSQLRGAGNVGGYRPQVRGLWEYTGDVGVRLGASVAPPDFFSRQDVDRDGILDGYTAGQPLLEGLAELRMMTEPYLLLGVSAHRSVERFEVAGEPGTSPQARDADAWSIHGHAQVQLGSSGTLRGEVFRGQNMRDLGGLGPGLAPGTLEPVVSIGGFGEVGVALGEVVSLVGGLGVDDPHDAGLTPGEVRGNRVVYGQVLLRPDEGLELGVEYTWWTTERSTGDLSAHLVNSYLRWSKELPSVLDLPRYAFLELPRAVFADGGGGRTRAPTFFPQDDANAMLCFPCLGGTIPLSDAPESAYAVYDGLPFLVRYNMVEGQFAMGLLATDRRDDDGFAYTARAGLRLLRWPIGDPDVLSLIDLSGGLGVVGGVLLEPAGGDDGFVRVGAYAANTSVVARALVVRVGWEQGLVAAPDWFGPPSLTVNVGVDLVALE